MFRKYMHIEKYGNDEVQGIELGKCYIFPKLDGTNGQVWYHLELRSGSRNRELSIENDNAGFHNYILNGDLNLNFKNFFDHYPFYRLYGEWLVPHSLKTYRDESWRKFYIFDVYDDENEKYIRYEDYKPILDNFGFDYISPICIIKNATYDNLLHELDNNTFLIKDGNGVGEGIVIKNYDFKNKFNRVVWAKIITNEFKEKNSKEFRTTLKVLNDLIEDKICEKYVTKHLIDKVYSKIVNEMNGWSSKYIQRLLQNVFYDLIREESWNIIKEFKNPTINYKTLNHLTILKIKELKSELF